MKALLLAVTLMLFACGHCAQGRQWLALFGSDDCDQCQQFKAEWQESEFGADSPALIYICIDRDENYTFLKDVEAAMGYQGQFKSFPVALCGKRMACGIEDIRRLSDETDWETARVVSMPLLEGVQAAADAAQTPLVSWNADAGQGKVESAYAMYAAPVQLLYLSTPGCQKCARQEVELRLLKERLPNLAVAHYEVTTEEGLIQMRRVVEHFGIATADNASLAPLVAWENGYVTGELATSERLHESLSAAAGQGGNAFWLEPIADAERAALKNANRDFLDKMTISATLLAGLIDGINPCAFATVIFLVSYLLYLKRGRHFVLAAGLLFCAGVFCSYLLFGVGISYIVDYLNRFAIVKRIFYFAFAVAGVVLAMLHLRDALRYRKSGNVADMEMGLDAGTHRRIHDRIHGWAALTGWLVLPATVVLGVVVSAMEFVCTGQIYLPTIIAINSAGFNLRAFGGLLLYNVAFILPLIAVTVLAYFGVGAKSLALFARRHVFATKVLMTILFLLLAILMAILAMAAY